LKLTIKYISLFCLLFVSFSLSAQKEIKDEGDLIKAADELFKQEEYIKAFSMYQTLLSNHTDNAEYNFRYAVCLMYADRSDKTKPIFYLEKAEKDPKVDRLLYYFLGKAYQMNYQFTSAIRAYEKFKKEARSNLVTKYDIDRRIEECDNGILLLSAVRGIYVISDVEVKEQSFYRSYNTDKAGGKIIILPEELRSKLDKKNNAPRTAFFIPNSGTIYFSSYGKKGENGLDIYRSQRNPDGSWSESEPLKQPINTPYDDAYPYIAPNGRTLFFSSKGHNTMGEYDIFRSRFDLSSFRWNSPENMSFPLNTPFDEILFIPDTNEIYAFFSSNRNSPTGLIDVYRIGLNKRPDETIDLASIYKNEDMLETGIQRVKDMADLKQNIRWDQYEKSKEQTGDFLGSQQDTTIAANQKLQINDLPTKISLTKEEVMDSVFSTYAVMKQKEEELKKKRQVIGRVNQKTKKLFVKR
jgi:hypothetical protein